MLMLTFVWLVLQGTLLLDKVVYPEPHVRIPGAAEPRAQYKEY